MLLFAVTIFLSAFLLFQVQPVIAKAILPWFGGSAAVWATCLLFFQSVLLLGYAYSHGLIRRLSPRAQFVVHGSLLLACLVLLPITPDPAWKPSGLENPTLRILGLLAATIGLPYFLLSTTGPLIQAWYVQANPGSTPYRLFALSNLGSMLALLSYPVLIEPGLSLQHQSQVWSVAFAAFALLSAATGWLSTRKARAIAATEPAAEPVAKPPRREYLIWVLLAACPSMLLLAVTNHLTQDVASIPFLWIVPLALYLLSFILCFDAAGWYRRTLFLILSAPALGGMAYLVWHDAPAKPEMKLQIGIFAAAFFVACMVCHGELARLKPHPRHLTAFYLMVSAGGALGGVFVAVVAPYAFNANYEFPIALALTGLLIAGLQYYEPFSVFRRDWLSWPSIALLSAAALLAGFSVRAMLDSVKGSMVVDRNFYGELRVRQTNGVYDWEGYRTLVHGATNHGEQYTHPARRKEIATYYCENTGLGLAMAARVVGTPQKVGIIGLGTGTVAAYGRPGDVYRFYELNPLVQDISNSQFTYLKDSDAGVEVVLGDARLSLERETLQSFDILVVDAFSSDSIPVHLLTKEAIALYFRHLLPRGILAIHISNRYIDLKPVLERVSRALSKPAYVVETDEDDEAKCFGTTWVLLANDTSLFERPAVKQAGAAPDAAAWLRLWTDDYSNIYKVLK